MMWLCLGMNSFITQSDEFLVYRSGIVHAAHCVAMNDVVFYSERRQLGRLR